MGRENTMKYEIAVCTKEGDSTTFKGNLLEKLAREILEVQQYKVTETVRITGMEIDLLARHKISNSTIFVECKAWDGTLPADVITKLLGNVVWQTEETASVDGHNLQVHINTAHL